MSDLKNVVYTGAWDDPKAPKKDKDGNPFTPALIVTTEVNGHAIWQRTPEGNEFKRMRPTRNDAIELATRHVFAQRDANKPATQPATQTAGEKTDG